MLKMPSSRKDAYMTILYMPKELYNSFIKRRDQPYSSSLISEKSL